MQKGKQRELILNYLKKNNSTIMHLARELQIGRSTISGWLSEKNLLPEIVYKFLDVNCMYSGYVIRHIEENWGRVKGGLNSPGNTKKIKSIAKNSDLAEFFGILFGDGNSYMKKTKGIGVYAIRIVGDSRYDSDYITNYVKLLGEKIFGIFGKISYSSTKNAIILTFYSREMLYFLRDLGFPPGDKISNKIVIPFWIKSNRTFLRKFIRGLFDTDGSIFRMSRKDPRLLRIDLTNLIPNLLIDIKTALVQYYFNPSKIISGKHFFLSRKEDVGRYISEIGFGNSKHINRAILLASM